MCNFRLEDAFKLDPFDLLGRRKERESANKERIAIATSLESDRQRIEEEKRKKRIARAPIETVFGGSQVQQEGGVTLGQ